MTKWMQDALSAASPFESAAGISSYFIFSFYRSVIVPQNPPDKTVNAKKSIPMH
jgi:hypothetical protein